KATTEFKYGGSTQNLASNLLGSFVYNSLADLEAGIPASFTRTLTARQRSSGQYAASISLGDSYRRSQDLQIQYGVRIDGRHFTERPLYNAAVESAFGRRNDQIPNPISF